MNKKQVFVIEIENTDDSWWDKDTLKDFLSTRLENTKVISIKEAK